MTGVNATDSRVLFVWQRLWRFISWSNGWI